MTIVAKDSEPRACAGEPGASLALAERVGEPYDGAGDDADARDGRHARDDPLMEAGSP
jgi:hypothetical protein